MSKTSPKTLPTIHLNGTSATSLAREAEAACGALTNALEALAAMAPHGRDYYPQGPDAYTQAAEEHRSRLDRLETVSAEVHTIYEHAQEPVVGDDAGGAPARW